ncbi:MAG: hypothetical protein U0M42_05410, partial [Acutalibacteraceae bacterium]|nr:hypothetical protein [Acutalibacteraceae bacterium]
RRQPHYVRYPQKYSRTACLERVALLLISSPQRIAFIIHRMRQSTSPNSATPADINIKIQFVYVKE